MTNDMTGGLWGAAHTYDQYMGRWSRRVAPLFVQWLAAPRGGRWVDLGCGTGALSASIVAFCEPTSVLGLDTAESFVQTAAREVPAGTFRVGDALATGLPDASFDAAVSGLVLNFVRDPEHALREMRRLVRPGGVVAVYVWDYAGHMQIMRRFFDGARRVDPGAAAYDDGVNAPVCRPDPLRRALAGAGLEQIDVTALDLTAAFGDFEDYWTPFLGGTGSAPKYVASLDDPARQRVREAVRALLPTGPDGEILLAVRAWAARGTVST